MTLLAESENGPSLHWRHEKQVGKIRKLMSQRRLFRGPRCSVQNCRSMLYYTADGLTYCQNNHQKSGEFEYQIDEDEAMASGFGSRRKRGPDRDASSSQKDSGVYHGKVGYAAYLQAYQLIMRHQARFITEKLQVPPFESLLKQLWQVFLETQNAQDHIPVLEDDDVVEGVSNASDTPMPSSSPMPTHEQSDDSEGLSDRDMTKLPQLYTNARYSMHRPVLIHSIALCYLVLILLRVPITIHDFKTWIDRDEMPYMRAIRHIPHELLARLEPQYYEALDPQLRPTPTRLWKWTQQTALFFTMNAGIKFPEINYRPLLFAMVKDMALPLDVYNAVDEETSQLDLALIPDRKSDAGAIAPECRLLCLVLVVAKLFYNLDGVKRNTGLKTEPPLRGPDVRAWQRILKIQISALQGVDLASKTTAKDILSMTDVSLDEYMNWYSKTWVSRTHNRGLFTPEGILDIFNIGSTLEQLPKDDIDAGKDRLETIKWLYSQPYERLARSNLTPGMQYTTTSLDKPSTTTSLFDDLIELAGLQNSMKNRDLRKHINNLEHRLAVRTNSPTSRRTPHRSGKSNVFRRTVKASKSAQDVSTAEDRSSGSSEAIVHQAEQLTSQESDNDFEFDSNSSSDDAER